MTINANDNAKHEGFDHAVELALDLGEDPKFVTKWSRCVGVRTFKNYYWFLRFETAFEKEEAKQRMNLKVL